MKRMEIIFSQSIDEDFVQKCAEKDVGKFFTKIPARFVEVVCVGRREI